MLIYSAGSKVSETASASAAPHTALHKSVCFEY